MPGLVQSGLGRIGVKPDLQLRVPFPVLDPVIGRTDMLATVPHRMAKRIAASSKTQIAAAPQEFQRLTYMQIWHPRHQTVPVRRWFRELIKEVAA